MTSDTPSLSEKPQPRRWEPGPPFQMAGIWFRVVPGSKPPGRPGCADLRLDWFVGEEGWVPIPMRVPWMMSDFLSENEDVLYPPEHGQEGGRRYLRFLRYAVRLGWEKAEAARRADGRQLPLFGADD